MAKLYNLARMSSATTGTGTITLAAAVSGFLTFAQAGVQNGDVVAYAINEGVNSEIGYGTYSSSGPTLTRTVRKSTNSNSPISLAGSAEVFITPAAEDLLTEAERTKLGLARDVLTANRNYYVRSDGSDSNDGLSNTSGGAFATIDKASQVIAQLDIGIYDVTVNVGAGSYPGFALRAAVGVGTVSFIGDETTPANVTVTGSTAVACSSPGIFIVAGMKLVGTSAQDFFSENGKTTLRNNEYAGSSSNYRVYGTSRSITYFAGTNNKISAGGAGMWLADGGASMYPGNSTWAVTTNVTFVSATATCRRIAYMESVSLVVNLGGNTVTGPRYLARENGVIATTGGANNFPGSTAGSTLSGGQYA